MFQVSKLQYGSKSEHMYVLICVLFNLSMGLNKTSREFFWNTECWRFHLSCLHEESDVQVTIAQIRWKYHMFLVITQHHDVRLIRYSGGMIPTSSNLPETSIQLSDLSFQSWTNCYRAIRRSSINFGSAEDLLRIQSFYKMGFRQRLWSIIITVCPDREM